MLYVGQVNSQNIPHGQRYLYQPGGERHEGQFENGRAHGVGCVPVLRRARGEKNAR
jgi:hypothetical protein